MDTMDTTGSTVPKSALRLDFAADDPSKAASSASACLTPCRNQPSAQRPMTHEHSGRSFAGSMCPTLTGPRQVRGKEGGAYSVPLRGMSSTGNTFSPPTGYPFPLLPSVYPHYARTLRYGTDTDTRAAARARIRAPDADSATQPRETVLPRAAQAQALPPPHPPARRTRLARSKSRSRARSAALGPSASACACACVGGIGGWNKAEIDVRTGAEAKARLARSWEARIWDERCSMKEAIHLL
ncbi:hypothetical protein C8R45DRAFT_1221375 [Mycena sanguinolenta]|nr:hypothetical protein C8R45DRAFT_1221375 [Mycena sanguinolenta]